MLKKINLPRELAHHLIGKHHTTAHRMGIGLVIMIAGVGTAKAATLVSTLPMHMTLDLVGYLIHGLGAVPFIEYIIASDNSSDHSEH